MAKNRKRKKQVLYDDSKYIIASQDQASSLYHRKPQPFNYKLAYNYFNDYIFGVVNKFAKEFSKMTIRLYTYIPSNQLKSYNTNKFRIISKDKKLYFSGKKSYQPSTKIKRLVSDYSDNFAEVLMHPSLDYLYDVNSYTNYYESQWLKCVDELITGNAYWFNVYDPVLNVPVSRYYVPSINTYPIPSQNKNKLIDGYAYGQNYEKQIFDLDQIIQFKMPNPQNLYYGAGLIERMWPTAQLNLSNINFRLALSENMGRPDYIVFQKELNGGAQKHIDRYADQLDQIFASNRNHKKFAGVPGNIGVETLTMPPKDLMLDVDDMIIRKLSIITDISEAVLRSTDGNYSNLNRATRSFFESVMSFAQQDEEKLNEVLIPLFNLDPKTSFFAYDSIVKEDEEEENRKIQVAIQSNAYSLGQLQKMQGEIIDEDLADIYVINGKPYTKEQLMYGTPPQIQNSIVNPQKEMKMLEDKIKNLETKEPQKPLSLTISNSLSGSGIEVSNDYGDEILEKFTSKKIEPEPVTDFVHEEEPEQNLHNELKSLFKG